VTNILAQVAKVAAKPVIDGVRNNGEQQRKALL
jgi:hypothetical protein